MVCAVRETLFLLVSSRRVQRIIRRPYQRASGRHGVEQVGSNAPDLVLGGKGRAGGFGVNWLPGDVSEAGTTIAESVPRIIRIPCNRVLGRSIGRAAPLSSGRDSVRSFCVRKSGSEFFGERGLVGPLWGCHACSGSSSTRRRSPGRRSPRRRWGLAGRWRM